MNRRVSLGLLTGLIIAVAIFAVGCDGGGNGDGAPAVPGAAGTATLEGQVVAADSPETPVPNAVVTVQETGRSAISDANGRFTINNLAAGDRTVAVTTPQSEDLGTASARVPLNEDETTTVSFAVLPLGLEAPEQILIDPANATIDVNGRLAYRSQVVGPNNQALEDIEPTWVVEGGVGQISPDGIFTAENVGTGEVRAFSGTAERAATVVVVGQRPPQISSFRVNPQTLPASGGQIFISAAVRDGDGVLAQHVAVRILPPGGEPVTIPVRVTNPDSAIACPDEADCYMDASFGADWDVPPNDNTPTQDGIQANETYSATLLVRDRDGMTARSEFVEFVVQGIDAPPARPGI